MEALDIIGRAERIDLPDLHLQRVPAKTDTGADASSIWAHATEVRDGKLHVIFFGEGSDYYTGEEIIFQPGDFTITRVASSFGHREIRYKVKLRVRVKGRVIRASFTLSDRKTKLYPILIGRSMLHKKFLVDVSTGEPLVGEERKRAKRLQEELINFEGKATS